jgi:DNA topoisomerase-2
MMQGDTIEDLKEFHKDNTVDFVLKMKEDVDKIQRKEGGVEKLLKLSSNISCNNFVLFDKDHKIKRYENEVEILEEFYQVRLELYKQRKTHMMRLLEKEIAILTNKSRFISELNKGQLKIQGISKVQIIELLIQNNYMTQVQIDQILDPKSEDSGKQNFEYLLSMSIWSLTLERVDQIEETLKSKNRELDDLRASTAQKLWRKDLEEFKKTYDPGCGKQTS